MQHFRLISWISGLTCGFFRFCFFSTFSCHYFLLLAYVLCIFISLILVPSVTVLVLLVYLTD